MASSEPEKINEIIVVDQDSSITPTISSLEPLNEDEKAFVSGLVSFFQPTVSMLDEKLKATRESQITLRQEIDFFAEELRRISEEHQAPYDLEPYVKKLQESKKRIAVVSSILQNAQDRLTKLHQNVMKETTKRKTALETSGDSVPHPPE